MTPQSARDVAAARSGEQQAFGRLIEAIWPRLVRLARSIVGDADAEDVAQDACITCWRKLSQLADPARFDSWLMRIVFTRAVRRARWQRLRLVWDPALAGLRKNSLAEASGGSSPSTESDLFVEQILSHLPPRQRAVLHLTVVEGMTDSEIAEALRIRAGSVRAHRRRARERIEAALSNHTCKADLKPRPTSARGAGLQPCATRTSQQPPS